MRIASPCSGVAVSSPRAAVGASVAMGFCDRLAAQEPDRVRDRVADRLTGLADAFRAAGKVDDQGAAARSGDAPREHPVLRVLTGRCAQGLGDAGRLAVDHRPRGLGRDVVGCETRASRGEDELAALAVRVVPERPLDLALIVGHDFAGDDVRAEPFGEACKRRTARIFLVTLAPGSADRDDCDAHRPGGHSYVSLLQSLLPPDFASSTTSSIATPRSTPLTMS